jgi:hypothetical protein
LSGGKELSFVGSFHQCYKHLRKHNGLHGQEQTFKVSFCCGASSVLLETCSILLSFLAFGRIMLDGKLHKLYRQLKTQPLIFIVQLDGRAERDQAVTRILLAGKYELLRVVSAANPAR